MHSTPLLCPHCQTAVTSQDQFCPICKLRLTQHLVNNLEEPLEEVGKRRTRAKELSLVVVITARLAGASLLWPLIAAFLTFYQGAGAKAIIAVVMGLIPCVAALTSFFIASNCFRAELKGKDEGVSLFLGVGFTLAGIAVWYYGTLFFLQFKL